MKRLKHILLAGTLVPALTLTLIPTSGWSQDAGDRPGAKRHNEGGAEHGKRGEGAGKGERRAGGGEDNGGAGKAKRAGGDDNDGPGKAKRAGAGDNDGPGKAKRAGAGDNDGPGKAKRAGAGDNDNAGKAKRAGGDDDTPRGGGKRKKEAEGDNAGSRAAERREERRERKENARGDRKPDSDNDRRAGDRKPDNDNDRRVGDRKRDNDNDRRTGDRKPDNDNDRRVGDRKRDNDRDNDRRAGDRKRDNDRDNDRRVGDRKRDNDNDRRTGDRDNNRGDDRRQNAQERRQDNREDKREERREDRRLGDNDRRDGPGFGGGFLPAGNARRLDDLRRDRREVREGNRVFIREPGRTIVRENGRAFIVHDETDRYRALGYNVRRERRGEQFIDTVTRPNGDVIITYTDNSGRLLRRARRGPGGREVILIDNGYGGRVRPVVEDVVVLPPPQVRIPRDRYVVNYGAANASLLYDTLSAPPVATPPQRYTLDQVRYSPDVRNYVRQVDINTINFESGSWEVPRDAESKLEALAGAINKSIDKNPNAVFLIEGYTDATGNPDDNLSLSDRRAQSVAEILTKDFKIPPENLTTQGYGQQNPKEQTDGPSAANRRVVVRNITQLLASGEGSAEH